MTDSESSEAWEFQARPHRTQYYVYGAAFVIAAAHIAVGFLLKVGSSGVLFRTADQIAMGLLGLILGGLVLLLTRPRVRAGAAGVSVRNLLGYRLIPWSEVADVSFPGGARWARIELLDDEYTPLMAIQSADKERAVQAMDRLRELLLQYRPDLSSHSTTS